MKANIFNIQHYSTGDGRGIRTTIFFKGCNMHCPWCHNPESISNKPQLLYYDNLCINCGLCVKVCESNVHSFIDSKHKIINLNNCALCGKCIDVCLNALNIVGKLIDLECIKKEILQDISYYKQSGGGVTFSGGEPLIQAEAIRCIMNDLEKENINFTIDTSLNCTKENLEKTLKCDTYLVDIKTADNIKFASICGGNLNTVISNLNYLISKNKEIILRIPLIPDFNINNNEIDKIINMVKQFKLPVMLLPYHNLGKSKYKALCLEYKYDVKTIEETQLKKIKQRYIDNKIKIIDSL
jgi:pyruvate formate lyase activating enzyme